MVSRLKPYLFGVSDPRRVLAERMRQLITLKLNPPDQTPGSRLDILLPVLISKRKIDEMNAIREHINVLVMEEELSSDQMKSLVFLRGLEALTADCKESVEVYTGQFQKFMGELPR